MIPFTKGMRHWGRYGLDHWTKNASQPRRKHVLPPAEVIKATERARTNELSNVKFSYGGPGTQLENSIEIFITAISDNYASTSVGSDNSIVERRFE